MCGSSESSARSDETMLSGSIGWGVRRVIVCGGGRVLDPAAVLRVHRNRVARFVHPRPGVVTQSRRRGTLMALPIRLPNCGLSHEDSMTTAPRDRTVVSADGTRLAVSVVGDGPPLVLVPGAFQHRGFGGVAEIAAALSEHFTVAYFDRRGRGASGDTLPYSLDKELQDLRAVIDELGGFADAIGLCAGGALVLHGLAAGLPIKRAVVWEPPYRVAGEPEAAEPYEARLRALLDRGKRATAARYYLTRVLGLTWRRALSLRSRGPVWRGLLDAAGALDREAATLNDLRLPADVLAAIDAPTLLIVGSDSPDWMKNAVQAVVEHVQGSAHTVLQNQTHDVEPSAIAPAAISFLEH